MANKKIEPAKIFDSVRNAFGRKVIGEFEIHEKSNGCELYFDGYMLASGISKDDADLQARRTANSHNITWRLNK